MQGFVDLANVDPDHIAIPEERVRALLPHDHEFRLVDRMCFVDPEERVGVGYKDWGADAWWAKGHVPGRPLMPGVLMVEGCAQVATVMMKVQPDGWDPARFIAMGGVDKARFRQTVIPPARVFFAAKCTKNSRKIGRFDCQAFCNGELVMEMELVGVLL